MEAETYNNQISEAILLSPNVTPFLNTGRVVVIKSESVSSCIHFSHLYLRK